jgi:hypothetical protein
MARVGKTWSAVRVGPVSLTASARDNVVRSCAWVPLLPSSSPFVTTSNFIGRSVTAVLTLLLF